MSYWLSSTLDVMLAVINWLRFDRHSRVRQIGYMDHHHTILAVINWWVF
jgi:hypothetical protein